MESRSTLAKKVALSCRILARLGLFKETTGHVSARSPDGGSMLIRGRGPSESGLLYTESRDIIQADFDGRPIQNKSRLKPPQEVYIHGELYKARPEVTGIVHAHPPDVVLCSIAGIELKPIYGGYDPRGMRLALKGIPTYRSSLTLHTVKQVKAMMAIMADSDVCIFKGHGVVVTGKNVEEATITTIKLDALAKMNLRAAALGSAPSISKGDIKAFSSSKRGKRRTSEPLWEFYTRWLKEIES